MNKQDCVRNTVVGLHLSVKKIHSNDGRLDKLSYISTSDQ